MLLLCSCLFGIIISHSGASVSLMIKDGVSSFQDGSEVVLICTIYPYSNIMTWLVNNDPYADCFLGSCGATPNTPFTFIFNFDERNGEFNLTIQSVNTSHAGQLFACDDGNERKTITFNVTTGVSGDWVTLVPTCNLWCCWFDETYVCIIIIIAASLAILSYINAAVIYFNQQLSNTLLEDLNDEKCRLFIPYFGLFLIIRHCILYWVKPGTPQYSTQNENSVTNNSFNVRGRPASNGKQEKDVLKLTR